VSEVSRERASNTVDGPRPASRAADGGGGSRIRQRQRQRLIDACISALHIYGPSRTTVEKVVALADLSPGIVRFYFDSKAAMLVASLEHLAAEFQERVMTPVTRLKESPAQALALLVDLYLDADIASPRKVSVWYSFWGEASARQEYLDICGQKDDDFAALVHELIERMIATSGAAHLDADAVALGLIGVLEVLWQGFAFQSEANIDRAAAVARSRRYLNSVFPGYFGSPDAQPRSAASGLLPGRLPARAYADDRLLAAEREQLLRPAWQVLGHEAELRVAGDYVSGELAGERALVVRAERGRLHAFRNTCRRRPHALVSARHGRFKSAIHCSAHELTYTFDGHLVAGATPGDLVPLELLRQGRLVLVRATAGAAGAGERAGEVAHAAWDAFSALTPAAVTDLEVAADWKVLVEQWLETPLAHQHFVAPNQLLEIRAEGAAILQVIPIAAGRSRLRCFEFTAGAAAKRTRRGTAGRMRGTSLTAQVALAESTQAGLMAGADGAPEAGPVPPALAEFRARVAAVLHALPREPSGR
jgi:TetR/AcrR family transcriptional repressor of bet genes